MTTDLLIVVYMGRYNNVLSGDMGGQSRVTFPAHPDFYTKSDWENLQGVTSVDLGQSIALYQSTILIYL